MKARWLPVLPTIALIGLLLGPQSGSSASRASSKPAVLAQPNIVFILTDDQRWDETWAMPYFQADLAAHGISFSNMFVVNSLCCPARASILTGDYSHTTGVYGNGGTYGGFNSFHGDGSTIATWLHGAGYQTALVGKYLNGYPGQQLLYIPPGWDYWSTFYPAGASGGAYYNYTLNTNGNLVSYGSAEADYSTDVLTAEADSFIRTAVPGQPLFLYYSPFADHIPSTPAPKYVTRFQHLQPFRPPSYNEADVSDKPQWVQNLQLLDEAHQKLNDNRRKNVYRTLLSVDDAVNTLVTALTDTGRLANTMIVFTSDNGDMLGEHRWTNKQAAYEESIRVPLVIRYDPVITSARTDTHFVLNIDFAPTFAQVAGVPQTGLDGVSLVPLLTLPGPQNWRSDFLIEHLLAGSDRPPVPTYCAVRNAGFIYVKYQDTGEEELYDLTLDPYELQNAVTDPTYATTLAAMRARELVLCNPPPP
jgi:N-acetylglucosamine-6-sulfatase